MADVKQTTVQNISVVAAQVVARGGMARGTLDLFASTYAGAIGAWLYPRIGRGGTAAITGGVPVGVSCIIRPMIYSGGAAQGAGATPYAPLVTTAPATVAISTTCATADSNAGGTTLTVASGASFAQGDILCIQDSGGGVTRLEFARISKIATNVITVDSPLLYTHTAVGADTVRNQSDVFPRVWVDGGALWECVMDYGDRKSVV